VVLPHCGSVLSWLHRLPCKLGDWGLHVITCGGFESHSFSNDRRCELQQYCLVRTLCRLRSLCGACISDIAGVPGRPFPISRQNTP
jgi:hypothetical protein